MWKKRSFISLVLSFLFLLSACTNSPQEDSSQLEEVNPKTYLTVWAWDKEKYVSLIQKAADYFKNDGYDNVVIQVEDVGQSEILSRLESSFESDNVQSLPDIVLLSDESIAGMIGGYEDQFVDLRQEISMSQFAAYKTATVSFENGVYGVPFDSGTVGLFYKKDIIEEVGYKEADMEDLTWSGLMDIAKDINQQTGMKVFPSIRNRYKELIRMILQSTQSTYKSLMETNNLVEHSALRRMSEILKEIETEELSDEESTDKSAEEFVFQLRKVDFLLELKDIDLLENGWSYTHLPIVEGMPNATRYGQIGGTSLMVLNTSENKEMAIQFLRTEFTGNNDFFTDILLNDGVLSAYIPAHSGGAYEGLEDVVGGQAIYKDFSRWTTLMPVIEYEENYQETESIFLEEFEKYMKDEIDLDTMLHSIEEKYRKVEENK